MEVCLVEEVNPAPEDKEVMQVVLADLNNSFLEVVEVEVEMVLLLNLDEINDILY